MRRFNLLSVLLLVATAACSTRPATTAPAEFSLAQAADSIPVAFGKTVSVDRILLTFVDVPQDSRCPASVQCVWAGDATVRSSVALACTRATPACAAPELLLDLHTSAEPRSGQYSGMSIELLALVPAPEVPEPIRKREYVAWFRIRPVPG
jgi:hypothetical protein